MRKRMRTQLYYNNGGNRTMAHKYAVWQIGKEENTKDYVYANTHREARDKYARKHSVGSVRCDSQKV